MEKDFEFYAFINYQRRDQKWAKWLQSNLESFQLPSDMSEEHPQLPKRLYPIFLDTRDLICGDISANLSKAATNSQYLIVICSPTSAKSHWVGETINQFKSLGRTNRIIPLIVEGEPHSSNPDSECLHPALMDDAMELLTVNVQKSGKTHVLAQLIASILDVRVDSIYQHLRRRQKQKAIAIIIIAALLLAPLLYLAF